MTDRQTDNIPAEQTYLDSLHLEAMQLPENERDEHLALIAELAGLTAIDSTVEMFNSELAAEEFARAEAERYIQEAKSYKRPEKQSKEKVVSKVDLGRIGWADGDKEVELDARIVETPELTYRFVNLTSLNKAANDTFQKLRLQSEHGSANLGDQLLEEVATRTIPGLHQAILTGGKGLRPVSLGGRNPRDVRDPAKTLNTSYPGYKEDVRGSKNRALILRLDDSDNVPTYAVAALYDHDDDTSIHRSLFARTKLSG